MTLASRCAAQLIDSLVCAAATDPSSADASTGISHDEAHCVVESLASMYDHC